MLNFIFFKKEKVVKHFIPQCQKLVRVLRKTRITSLTFVLIFFFILSYTAGPNLDKKCIWLSDAAPSHEICRKIYFDVKPYKKVLIEGGEILSALFVLKGCSPNILD